MVPRHITMDISSFYQAPWGMNRQVLKRRVNNKLPINAGWVNQTIVTVQVVQTSPFPRIGIVRWRVNPQNPRLSLSSVTCAAAEMRAIPTRRYWLPVASADSNSRAQISPSKYCSRSAENHLLVRKHIICTHKTCEVPGSESGRQSNRKETVSQFGISRHGPHKQSCPEVTWPKVSGLLWTRPIERICAIF
jgi:hypothetical protein